MSDPGKQDLNSAKATTTTRDVADESVTSIEQPDTIKEMEIISSKGDDISIAPSHASTMSKHVDEEKGEGNPNPPTTLSRTVSVIPEAVVVERRNRRGLFGKLALIPEVENPYHYTRRIKWFITFVIAICGAAAPMGSAIVMPTLIDIAQDFNASATIANMSVAVYMLAMAIFPLWWSSFSETAGRRTIYIVSFILFVVFAVLTSPC
jgi:hypothetical protein